MVDLGLCPKPWKDIVYDTLWQEGKTPKIEFHLYVLGDLPHELSAWISKTIRNPSIPVKHFDRT